MNSLRLMTGRRVLIVEDEYFIADEMRQDFEEAGAKVLGPVPTVEAALSLLGRTPALDGAVLDIKLRGEMGYPIADALIERGVPFVFSTGYDAANIPAKYGSVARCEKPVEAQKVGHALFA